MDKKNEAIFQMMDSVSEDLKQNQEVLTPIPGFSLFFNKFDENQNQLHGCVIIQQTDYSGLKVVRDQSRGLATIECMSIINKMRAYCNVVNDQNLMSQINYTLYQIKRASISKVITIFNNVYEKAYANLAQLSDYGIDNVTLPNYRVTIDKLIDDSNQFKKNRIALVNNTKTIEQLITENEELLVKLDSIMNIIEFTQPPIFKSYWDARKVNPIFRRLRALSINVTDSQSGDVLAGVIIAITAQESLTKTGEPKEAKKMVKKTSAKGNAFQNNLSPGNYNFTAQKLGFKPFSGYLSISSGKTTNINIHLDKE